MKLLLTSNGLCNQSIANALFELVGKPASEINLIFIPTAMNVGDGDKGWFINDLYNIKKQGFKFIDIVDISALPKSIWQSRIEKGDVLFFSGGSTPHLMRWLKESGLDKLLPELLKTRVYAGISAGSIATNPTLTFNNKDKQMYYKEKFGYSSEDGLNIVDIYVRPHLNSPAHKYARKEYIEAIAKEVNKPIYAIDDESALKIDGDKIEVISEGEYFIL
jgi:dipeptidase E